MPQPAPRRRGSDRRDPIFLPDVQTRADYTTPPEVDRLAESVWTLYERRLESANLNPTYFRRLLAALEDARATRDSSRLATAHAQVLLQTEPAEGTVTQVRRIVSEIATKFGPTSELERLAEIVEMMEENANTNSSAYVVGRVNWSISNACPMICKGCYNPFVADTIDLVEAQRIVDKLSEHGTTAIMFTGGDPLLWDGIGSLLKYTRAAGLTTGLDTTGHTLSPTQLKAIAPSVDTFGLPLDGSTEDIVRKFRRGPTVGIVERLQAILRELDGIGAHVRVHTVVHKANIEDLGQIAAILERHRSVRQWALYQFWGRRASRRIRNAMEVDTSEFIQRTAELSAGAIEVLPYAAKRREMTNFIIQASGQVTTSAGQPGEEFIIGNILTDSMKRLVASPAVAQRSLITKLVGHGYADQASLT